MVPAKVMRPAVFIDKDGTLVENVPYNVDPNRLVFTPNALPGLRLLAQHGYRLVVVSNQPGVALGYFGESALAALRTALIARLASHGVRLSGVYCCTHAPDAGCACRKPAPGLFHRASEVLNIDLTQSWMVGDILDDVEAGHRAGCRSVLLDVGNETEWKTSPLREPDLRADDLLQAALAIVAAGKAAPPPRARRTRTRASAS